jgi:hypothetical protein
VSLRRERSRRTRPARRDHEHGAGSLTTKAKRSAAEKRDSQRTVAPGADHKHQSLGLHRDPGQPPHWVSDLDVLVSVDATRLDRDASEQTLRICDRPVVEVALTMGNAARAGDDRHLGDVHEQETGS